MPSSLRLLQRGLATTLARLRALWRLTPPLTVAVGAAPDQCLHTLAIAARPSQERLHLRAVFTDGRRYYVRRQKTGFRLTSDTRQFWGSRRQRTRVASVVFGVLSVFEPGKTAAPSAGEGSPITFVHLRARMSLPYSLSALLIPTFIGSIVFHTAWPTLIRALLIAALFALSWIGHRLDAAYQSNEMVFFVQKALEDLPRAEIPLLPPATASGDVILNADFRAVWARFYQDNAARDGAPPYNDVAHHDAAHHA